MPVRCVGWPASWLLIRMCIQHPPAGHVPTVVIGWMRCNGILGAFPPDMKGSRVPLCAPVHLGACISLVSPSWLVTLG